MLAVAFLALLFIAIPGPRDSVAALFTAVDENGANDEPGQKDLTRLSVDTIGGGLAVTWNWDVISLSGNNTAEPFLFDSDGDGFANSASSVGFGNEVERGCIRGARRTGVRILCWSRASRHL
jgi:hypothetical protein